MIVRACSGNRRVPLVRQQDKRINSQHFSTKVALSQFQLQNLNFEAQKEDKEERNNWQIQTAQRNSHKATCAERLAQCNLHTATCAEQLAQGNLHRATCAEQLAQGNVNQKV